MQAQTGSRNTTSQSALQQPGDLFLLRAVDSALLIMQVDYVLRENKKKDPEDFGKDSLAYFGRVHGLAVASDGHYWFDPRLLQAWLYADADSYNDVKDEEHYKPVVSAIRFRSISGKQFEEYPFSKDSLPFSPLQALASLAAQAPTPTLPQMEPGMDSTGFILLLPSGTLKSLAVSDTAAVSLSIHLAALDFSDGNTGMYRTPLINRLRPPEGGAYFRIMVGTGQLTIGFSGVLFSTKGGDLDLLPARYTTGISQPVTPQKPTLSPINKSDKKSQQTPKGGKSKGKKK